MHSGVKRKFFGNKSVSPKLLLGLNGNVRKSCRGGPKLSEKSSCGHPVITQENLQGVKIDYLEYVKI